MLQKIIFITIFILLLYSNVFANDNYLMFNYGNGHNSSLMSQQKEEQTIYGIEYGKKLYKDENMWGSIEAAYSTHKYSKVDNSFLIKLWGTWKTESWNNINIYGGVGLGLSTYKDNDLVKRRPSASIGFRLGLEYQITEEYSVTTECATEHNSGIQKDDNGRNIDLIKMGFKIYF